MNSSPRLKCSSNKRFIEISNSFAHNKVVWMYTHTHPLQYTGSNSVCVTNAPLSEKKLVHTFVSMPIVTTPQHCSRAIAAVELISYTCFLFLLPSAIVFRPLSLRIRRTDAPQFAVGRESEALHRTKRYHSLEEPYAGSNRLF